MKIKAFCRTNLDGFDCSEITSFVTLPNKGDKVQVKYRGNVALLEVCGITHRCKNDEPSIEVELTGRPRE